MEHTLEVTYDRALIRRGLNRFMVKRFGWLTFALIFGLGALLIVEMLSGSWSSWFTAMLAIWIIVVAFLIVVYIARLRASEGFFQNSENCKVKFVFSDDGVKTDSDVGSSDIKWKVFDEVLKFSDVWLLVYAKSGYMTLPAIQLSEEAKVFIERKISQKAV
jgi:FtsH-binding integral membrane protein